jgi:poly(3-hydroxybutyrate) depolymerase
MTFITWNCGDVDRIRGPSHATGNTICAGCLLSAVLILLSSYAAQERETSSASPGRQHILVRSTRDNTLQPSYVIVPSDYSGNGAPTALVVALHTWNFTLEQRHTQFETGTTNRNWIYLFPNFRGVDDHSEACGSDIAQQDILDAVAWTRRHLKIDEKRIYLWGWSGGGHMALLMASRQPDLWAAVSAWAGITNMTAYYRERVNDRPPRTTDQLRACMGGPPGSSPAVDVQFNSRSPITTLARAARVPIDIWNGNEDDDVSFTHALAAFNKLAEATNSPKVRPEEVSRPQLNDRSTDAALGREIFLRRTAGPSRVTIYKGSHETIAGPTFEWFEKHRKE